MREVSMRLLLVILTCVILMLNKGRARRGYQGVSCGSHSASNCSQCPVDKTGRSHGRAWCKGDCRWRRGRCHAKQVYGEPAPYVPNFYMRPNDMGSMGGVEADATQNKFMENQRLMFLISI